MTNATDKQMTINLTSDQSSNIMAALHSFASRLWENANDAENRGDTSSVDCMRNRANDMRALADMILEADRETFGDWFAQFAE